MEHAGADPPLPDATANPAAARCSICQNAEGNRVHQAREMMLGLRHQFHYLECAGCGCLQLLDFPADFSPYYGGPYYSHQPLEPRWWMRALRGLRARGYFGRGFLFGEALAALHPSTELNAIAAVHPARNAQILDVGCGSGAWVRELRDAGFPNVSGIDPYIAASTHLVRKAQLADLSGTWDLIMFHHSFEHLPDPATALARVRELLSERGICLIRQPVKAEAWRQYGADWVQLDAPRHCFIHTEKSMALLAARQGLEIVQWYCDAGTLQFWGSELYRRDIPLVGAQRSGPEQYFNKEQMREFARRTRELNAEKRGDSAAFILRAASL